MKAGQWHIICRQAFILASKPDPSLMVQGEMPHTQLRVGRPIPGCDAQAFGVDIKETGLHGVEIEFFFRLIR